MRRHLTLILTLLIAAFGVAACGDESTVSDQKAESDAAATTAAADSTAQDTTATDTAPAQDGECKQVDSPGPKSAEGTKPKGNLPGGKTYTVVLETSCGTIEIKLNTKDDPKTSASFAGLVKDGFFDGLSFHRVVPGFVIQGGDPQGDGSGGPGYSVVEPPPSSQQYTKGVVAMAKTAAEKPGTSGSQFFIVTGDDAGLPPEYAVAGEVSKGMDVAEAIGNIPPQGGGDGPPTQPVVIEKATLKAE